MPANKSSNHQQKEGKAARVNAPGGVDILKYERGIVGFEGSAALRSC
jgi:hypothetical protein